MKLLGHALVLSGMLLLFGCGLSRQQQQVQRQQALEADLRSAILEREQMIQGQGASSLAPAMRAYRDRVESAYRRQGLEVDPLDQVFLSYSVALAERVDRREVTRYWGRYLMDRMDAELHRSRQQLALRREATQAQRERVWQDWWGTYWGNWQRNYYNPVNCTLLRFGSGVSTVNCD